MHGRWMKVLYKVVDGVLTPIPRLLFTPSSVTTQPWTTNQIPQPPYLLSGSKSAKDTPTNMQSPILYHSSPEGYPWTSRRRGLKLHVIVLFCAVLNLTIAILVVLVQQKKLYISDKPVYTMDGSDSPYYWKSLLPAIGGIIGNINSYIAGGGIALLVSTYAKHQGFNKGLNLKKISHLSLLGEPGLDFCQGYKTDLPFATSSCVGCTGRLYSSDDCRCIPHDFYELDGCCTLFRRQIVRGLG